MTISEKVAYLKGLAEGLDLDTTKSKEGKLISVMIGIMEELAMSVEDLEQVECPSCGADIVVDEDALSEGEVECPSCGTRYAMELTEDDEEDFEGSGDSEETED